MKKKEPQYPPLVLLNSVASRYPDVWEQMERIHESNGKDGLPSWPEWCYAPMSAAFAIAGNCTTDMFEVVKGMQAISAVAPWRLSKQVYRIDPDLGKLLIEQNDTSVPNKILLSLPFPSIYVDVSACSIAPVELPNLHGFFVHLEKDANTGQEELRILLVSKDGKEMFGIPVYIDAGTIAESQKRVKETMKKNEGRFGLPSVSFLDLSLQEDLITKLLQIILYLCSDNAEVVQRERKTASSSGQQPQKPQQGNVKDRYQDLRQWDVGIRVGNAIRRTRVKYDSRTAEMGSEHHASPRPHMRRGHWHHFWTGKRDEEENRKLILRWIPPTIVNAGLGEEELPARIQDVK